MPLHPGPTGKPAHPPPVLGDAQYVGPTTVWVDRGTLRARDEAAYLASSRDLYVGAGVIATASFQAFDRNGDTITVLDGVHGSVVAVRTIGRHPLDPAVLVTFDFVVGD